MNVILEPNPGSQLLFVTAPFREVLYHGTRGPGKTLALLMDFGKDTGRGWGLKWRGVLFRESYPQLADVVTKSKEWFPRIYPQAKFNKSNYTWTWPDGEELLFRHMARPEDYWSYHGHEYPWIGWEELTNWPTGECYDMMMATNRCSLQGVPKRVRSTCNPWGAGHHWVKALFIDQAPPGTPIVTKNVNPFTGEEIVTERCHLFGSLAENSHLLTADPEYVVNLMSIKDPNLRKAWLGGSWDIVAGGYFGDVWDYSKHVIMRPWTPPSSWRCTPSFDWGSASPFSVGFWAESDGTQAPDGNYYPRGALIRFDEWYGCVDGEPNVGLRLSNHDIGRGILERMHEWEGKGVVFSQGPADPSIWKEDGGPSIYSQLKRGAAMRDIFGPADNTRIPGWQLMREKLEGDEDRGPHMLIMSNCKSFLATVPTLPRDERNWDDVDTDAEDHVGDESRYMCTWKPVRSAQIDLGGL